MTETPYIAIGNEELESSPYINEGDTVEFDTNDGVLVSGVVVYGKNAKTGEKNNLIAAITAGERTYLVGVHGRALSGVRVVKRAEK